MRREVLVAPRQYRSHERAEVRERDLVQGRLGGECEREFAGCERFACAEHVFVEVARRDDGPGDAGFAQEPLDPRLAAEVRYGCALGGSHGAEDQPGQRGCLRGGNDCFSLAFLLVRAAPERRRDDVGGLDLRKGPDQRVRVEHVPHNESRPRCGERGGATGCGVSDQSPDRQIRLEERAGDGPAVCSRRTKHQDGAHRYSVPRRGMNHHQLTLVE